MILPFTKRREEPAPAWEPTPVSDLGAKVVRLLRDDPDGWTVHAAAVEKHSSGLLLCDGYRSHPYWGLRSGYSVTLNGSTADLPLSDNEAVGKAFVALRERRNDQASATVLAALADTSPAPNAKNPPTPLKGPVG
jgi:hypothetical protein